MKTIPNQIIALPHKSLRQKSLKVSLVDEKVQQVIAAMKKATLRWEASRKHEIGVALAAVQINQLLKIVIVKNNFDKKEDKSFRVLINPEITKYEGEIVEDYEGCLSIKDIYGRVPRHSKVRVKFLDENGEPQRLKAEGFAARIFQHEIDHTKGIVFVDHIKNNPEAFYRLDPDGHLLELDYQTDVKNNQDLWQ